jgi:hypothetical protein
MAWFSALTLIVPGIVVAAAIGGWLLWRRRRRPSAAPAVQTFSRAPRPVGKVAVRDVMDVEREARQAEADGDPELAARLYEEAGMLGSALSIYRRTGNIQKAAELELSTLQLRRASDVHTPVRSAELDDRPTPLVGIERPESLPTREMPVAYSEDFDGQEPTRELLSFGEDDPEPTLRMDLEDVIASLAPASMRDPGEDPFEMHTVPPRASSAPPRLPSVPPRLPSAPPARAENTGVTPTRPRQAPRSFPPAPPPKAPSEPPPRPKGPGIADLLAMLGPSPTPDLGNIEIYYRLGLLYLAAGKTEMARHAFVTVEDISPGYRDASDHLEQLAPPAAPPERLGRRPENQNAREVNSRSGVRGRDRFQEVAATATRGRRDDR